MTTYSVAFEFTKEEIDQLKAGAKFYYQVELDGYGHREAQRGKVSKRRPEYIPRLNSPWTFLDPK